MCETYQQNSALVDGRKKEHKHNEPLLFRNYYSGMGGDDLLAPIQTMG